MRIPVFVSCPTTLNDRQAKSRAIILKQLDVLQLEPRALGRSDYPTELPLREVVVVAKHCSGGVILGYTQVCAQSIVRRPGTDRQELVEQNTVFPTPWNHVECGILYSLGLPLLVFREAGISGGIFDPGVTDVFIHPMPKDSMKEGEAKALASVFLKWQARVREHYYR